MWELLFLCFHSVLFLLYWVGNNVQLILFKMLYICTKHQWVLVQILPRVESRLYSSAIIRTRPGQWDCFWQTFLTLHFSLDLRLESFYSLHYQTVYVSSCCRRPFFFCLFDSIIFFYKQLIFWFPAVSSLSLSVWIKTMAASFPSVFAILSFRTKSVFDCDTAPTAT